MCSRAAASASRRRSATACVVRSLTSLNEARAKHAFEKNELHGLRAFIHVELVDEHSNQPRYLQVQEEDDVG